VLGLLAVCLVAIPLGIVALVRIGRSGQSGRGLAIAGLVLASLWIVAGVLLVALVDADSADRDESGDVVGAGDLVIFDLREGDCFNGGPSGSSGEVVESVEAVPCDDPHDAEVFLIEELDFAEFPGDAAVESAADDICFPEFESYIGVAYGESEIEVSLLWPTEESWNIADDREVVCAVLDPAGPTTGSLRAAGR
jgi:hypothetical protein